MADREHRRLTQQRAYEKRKNIERIEAQMSELTSWSQRATPSQQNWKVLRSTIV